MHWQLRTRTLTCPRRPRVMGIVNVTPDSFSDGGLHLQAATAADAALRMEDNGADVIDIGGESTRPYSDRVDVQDELRRVLPVLERLDGRLAVPLSIDTSKAIVAREAIARGAEIINDVTGLEGDPEMADVAIASRAAVCVMHMQGTPQTMQDDPHYTDVVAEIHGYLRARRDDCLARGIQRDHICLDPGIGFGKSHEHNLTLLRNVRRFLNLQTPILVGHSRKGFVAHVLGDKQADRMAGTLGVSLALAAAGVQILRVHDVRETVDALKLFESAGGLD